MKAVLLFGILTRKHVLNVFLAFMANGKENIIGQEMDESEMIICAKHGYWRCDSISRRNL